MVSCLVNKNIDRTVVKFSFEYSSPNLSFRKWNCFSVRLNIKSFILLFCSYNASTIPIPFAGKPKWLKKMQHSTIASVETSPEAVPTTDSVPKEGATKKRVPKRVLHFCDGTLEEYSSDEEECKQEKVGETQLAVMNPGTLEWVPWFMYQTSNAGSKALAACDYLGEYLANFFGILSPKYDYEIEQYKKMLAEEEERKKEDLESGGWAQKGDTVLTEHNQPTAEPKKPAQPNA